MTASIQDASYGEGPKTLLTATKGYNAQLRLKKLSKRDTEGHADTALATGSHELIKHQGGIELKMVVKPTDEEQNFIREYKKLEEIEREKGIKFFRCIGDEPHTKEFVAGIDDAR